MPTAEAPGEETLPPSWRAPTSRPGHTLVTFTVDHLGFSSYTASSAIRPARLIWTRQAPESSTVEVRFPINAVSTTSRQLNEHLMSMTSSTPRTIPTARSAHIGRGDGANPDHRGRPDLRGIDQPVTLDATFYGAGTTRCPARGRSAWATTNVNRGDFNIDYALPVVSDRVNLFIDAAFEMGGGDSSRLRAQPFAASPCYQDANSTVAPCFTARRARARPSW